MPSQISNCKFRKRADGRYEYRIICHGKAITKWCEAASQTPLSGIGDIYVIKRGVGDIASYLPKTAIRGASVLKDGAVTFLGKAAFYKANPLPALIEYSTGRYALMAAGEKGELIISCSTSPVSAVLPYGIYTDGLPDEIKTPLLAAASEFLSALKNEIITGKGDNTNPTRAALTAISQDISKGKIVQRRGEPGAYLLTAVQNDDGTYRVSGITTESITLTLRFPYLPKGTTWKAEWTDDNLDYYVKGDLSVRPGTITSETKAVVKTSPHGGFILKLTQVRA